jgi:hypothetical protein
MPAFKSTYNILVKPDEDEVFESKHYDTPFLTLPPKRDWDYKREMKIEDVDIWEVIYEQGGRLGVYAAWCPYAEFYMILPGWYALQNGHGIETYYGAGAMQKVKQRMFDLQIPVWQNTQWVEDEKAWLYQKPQIEKKTFIPKDIIIQSA